MGSHRPLGGVPRKLGPEGGRLPKERHRIALPQEPPPKHVPALANIWSSYRNLRPQRKKYRGHLSLVGDILVGTGVMPPPPGYPPAGTPSDNTRLLAHVRSPKIFFLRKGMAYQSRTKEPPL